MKGFFSNESATEISSKKRTKKQKDPCEVCGLYKTCISPKMPYTGKGKLKILIVAEAPGFLEDQQNKQLIGDAGQLLRDYLDEFDIDLDRDCWKTNSLICRPPGNKTPTAKQIACCNPNLQKTIEELKPKFIWLLGGSAVASFWHKRDIDIKGGISQVRGLAFPDNKTGAWVIPMFHPSFVLRNEYDQNLKTIYLQDLEFAVACLDRDPPKIINPEKYIDILTEYKDVIEFLDYLINYKGYVAFDYETSNKKPYNPGQKVWSASAATKECCGSFPIDYPHFSKEQIKVIKKKWTQFLVSKKSKKIMQGIKFEEMWSRAIFGVEIANTIWCTMNAAHIIDSRKYFTGLKFQSYLQFGIEGYDKPVKKFIKYDPKIGRNRLDEFDLDKLLLYNGIDSFSTFRLYFIQYETIKYDDRIWAYENITHPGLLALSDMEENGIPVNDAYYKKQGLVLEKRIGEIENKLLTSKEAILFKKKYNREIKLGSPHDLRKLLYDILDCKIEKTTNKGNKSVDVEVLSKLNIPFANDLLAMRHIEKVYGTYFSQFIRESNGNIIHPFFDLHIPRSYRSGSSAPNFQNIPARDEEAKELCRRGIVASKGNKLLCVDFGAMEVRIIACVSKDPVLIKYIEDDFDMHGEVAKELFALPDDLKPPKKLRFFTKNCMVFPEFYGSYFWECAKNLHANCFDLKTVDDITVKQHLIDLGVISKNEIKMVKYNLFGDRKEMITQQFADFVDHVKGVEKNFWERYAVTKDFQQEVIEDYRKKGYVELITGFRRGEYLTKNEIINTKIQGPAFHCLLKALCYLNDKSKREDWKSLFIAQIHDEVIVDLAPREEEMVIKEITTTMEKRIRKMEGWEWIIVPLKAEPSITPVNGSWVDKKEVLTEKCPKCGSDYLIDLDKGKYCCLYNSKYNNDKATICKYTKG